MTLIVVELYFLGSLGSWKDSTTVQGLTYHLRHYCFVNELCGRPPIQSPFTNPFLHHGLPTKTANWGGPRPPPRIGASCAKREF